MLNMCLAQSLAHVAKMMMNQVQVDNKDHGRHRSSRCQRRGRVNEVKVDRQDYVLTTSTGVQA